jgi:hypothetical protein
MFPSLATLTGGERMSKAASPDKAAVPCNVVGYYGKAASANDDQ